jgi:hypothetical protein
LSIAHEDKSSDGISYIQAQIFMAQAFDKFEGDGIGDRLV